jgi:hypothetical protein
VIDVAPASTQARTTASICSGSSEMPGRTGAISTPHGRPASASFATVSTRRSGLGVCGSTARQTCSSRQPIEKAKLTSVRAAASASRSMSRPMSVDFVRIENGFAASVSTSTRPRVRR